MADKTPIRAVFNDSNVATGLAEFQTGDTIGLTHGGLGASLSIGTAGQVLKVNSGASALEFGNVEAIVNIDGATDLTSATLATGDQILLSDSGTEGRVTLAQLDTLFSGTSKTLTNKSIDLGSNTLTGSLAEFNSALQSDSFVSLTGSETLTNKTLTSPSITTPSLTTPTITSGGIIFEGSTADSFETTISVTDPTADRTITVPNATGTIVLADTTDTLTNKTIDADNNTLSNIEVDNLKSGVLDTDLSSVAGTDTTLASAKAIKAYVDSQVTAQDLDFQADSGGALSIDLDSESLTFTGGTGIDTSGSSNAVTFAIDSTVATLTGSQTLTNKTLTSPAINEIIFEGSTADSFETTLAVTDPTADRTITIPNVTGTIVTTGDTGSVTNTMLAGSIAASKLAGSIGNSKLSNSTVSYGGVQLSLGGTDATPAFNLSDATDYPTSSLSGTITNAQLAGSIANAKLANSSITVSDGSSSTATALGGTITFSGTANEVTVSESSGTVTVSLPDNVTIGNNLTVTGNLSVSGTTTTVDSTTISIQNAFTFEGATADSFETTLTTVDPTADRTISLPNATGTIVLKDTTDTLTNKSIDLANNTLTGSLSEFNSALQSESFVGLAASQTLTNKTLTSPIINTPTVGTSLTLLEDAVMIFEGATNDSFETTLTVVDPTADRTVSLPNATDTLVGKATTDTLTNKSIDSDNNTITNLVNADIKSSAAIEFSKMENLTASRALASDSNGDVSATSVTSTELGHLSGVTDAIQTQLDTKTTAAFAIAQAVALG
jgi:hypothetical protein